MSNSMPVLPTPHGEKLRALIANTKLPETDRPRVEAAIERYNQWRSQIMSVSGTQKEIVSELVPLLNEYKRYIDLDFIFDSPNDWLYRQKGQTKLDNSIIEEPTSIKAILEYESYVMKLARSTYED